MYHPEVKYSNRLVDHLCGTERARTILDRIEVDSAWEKNQRLKADCGFIADALAMEGMEASFDAVFDFLDGVPIAGESKEMKSVAGFKEALNYADSLSERGLKGFSLENLREMNRLCFKKLPGSEWHAGKFREIQTWVVDESRGEIAYTPSSPETIEAEMKGLAGWLKSEEAGALHPAVRAGLAHGQLMSACPFVYGNERTACLLDRLILKAGGCAARGWNWFTGYFRENKSRYYRELALGLQNRSPHDNGYLSGWLEYYVKGIREIYERLVDEPYYPIIEREAAAMKVSPISHPAPPPPADDLNERQRLILELGERYRTFHRRDIRSELEIALRYSPKTISRDLRALVKMGYIKQSGQRKGIHYKLVKSLNRQ